MVVDGGIKLEGYTILPILLRKENQNIETCHLCWDVLIFCMLLSLRLIPLDLYFIPFSFPFLSIVYASIDYPNSNTKYAYIPTFICCRILVLFSLRFGIAFCKLVRFVRDFEIEGSTRGFYHSLPRNTIGEWYDHNYSIFLLFCFLFEFIFCFLSIVSWRIEFVIFLLIDFVIFAHTLSTHNVNHNIGRLNLKLHSRRCKWNGILLVCVSRHLYRSLLASTMPCCLLCFCSITSFISPNFPASPLVHQTFG